MPERQRIKDRLPLLRSLQSIRSTGKAKPRSYGIRTVAPCGLQGRFGRGQGTTLGRLLKRSARWARAMTLIYNPLLKAHLNELSRESQRFRPFESTETAAGVDYLRKEYALARHF